MNKKRMIALSLAALMTVSGTTAWARSSKRAAWNDASSSTETSSTVKDGCYTEDGTETEEHSVYSNVYANSEEWSAWKETWQTIRSNYEQAALTPGEDATKVNIAWYSKKQETPRVKLMDENGKTIKIFKGTQDVDKAESFTQDEETVTLYPNKATITGLKENTTYKYSYLVDGKWSEKYTYTTQSTDSFSVMYVGDPQIGASSGQTTADGKTSSENGKEYYAMNDAYNWTNTLNSAISANSDLSFIISAGDQINQTGVSKDADKVEQQIEYAGFLSPSVLRSLPIATTIGNHDSQSVNYQNHFNNPNSTTDAAEDTATVAGTDYYFRYGNTLFVSINTNNYNCAEHETLINEAVEANPDATWRVLLFHQDIYGSGYDHSDSDGMILRTQLTPIIDEYDFDAVLQGHDHTYSRTYQISADGVQTSFDNTSATNTEEYYEANASCYSLNSDASTGTKIVDPEGTVYFEANSSTGSKYYQMIGTQQNYIAARSQSWRPTYQIIDVTENTLTVKTYDAATNEELVADGDIATSYTIVKSEDHTELQTAVSGAEKKLTAAKKAGNYTKKSISALTEAIKDAKSVDENAEATEAELSKACKSLEKAVKNLKAVTVKNVTVKTAKKSSTTSIKVTYGKAADASGYQVQYSTSKKMTSAKKVTVKGAATVTKTIKSLKSGKTYYASVRAYKTVDGQTFYGAWSKTVAVK